MQRPARCSWNTGPRQNSNSPDFRARALVLFESAFSARLVLIRQSSNLCAPSALLYERFRLLVRLRLARLLLFRGFLFLRLVFVLLALVTHRLFDSSLVIRHRFATYRSSSQTLTAPANNRNESALLGGNNTKSGKFLLNLSAATFRAFCARLVMLGNCHNP